MKKFFLVALFFLAVSFLVLFGVIFNDQLIGRSLDFSVPPVSSLLKNAYAIDFYQWLGTVNGGTRNTFISTLIPVNAFLYIPVLFKASPWLVARYQIVLTLFLGMLFFYILAQNILESYLLEKKYKTQISIMAAIFFTLNNYLFCELIFGSTVMYFTFIITPLFIYAINSYEKTKKWLYLFFALLLLVVISSTLQHMVFAYIILVIVAIFIYKDYKFFIKVGLLHLLLSLYWVLPMIFTVKEIAGAELTNDPTAALTVSSQSFFSALLNRDYIFSRDHYMLALPDDRLVYVWIFNAVILLAVVLYSIVKIEFFKKEQRKFIIGFAIMFLISVLFIKGGREPFGNCIIFLYKVMPVFNLFRSIQHYISFYVLAVSILFVFSSAYLIKKNSKSVYLLALVVIVNASPWWWNCDLGTKNITQSNKVPSYFGQFYLTEGNWKMYSLNNRKLNFSILPIPPGFSINFLAVGGNNSNYIDRNGIKIKTQGGDMGLAYGDKNFYAAEVNSVLLGKTLNNLEKEMYVNKNFFNDNKNIFSLLNVKYFVLREDTMPLFSKNAPLFNVENIKKAISNSKIFKSSATADYITILEDKDFLPHFYTPKNNIISFGAIENLPSIVSNPEHQIRSAIFFRKQNAGKDEILNQVQNDNKKMTGNQVVEFKKIDPTKYRVIIHNASGQFPLVFSENFHEGWRMYGAQVQSPKSKVQSLDEYKILDGNGDDQASKDELNEYISKGWVTSLGDGSEKEIEHQKWQDNQEKFDYTEKYNIDFISKNFQGTIQNDNLSNGHFWETWLQKPIENNANHLMANGYANSWVIDADKICAENPNSCTQNPDGTYDIETVIEFYPQRLFYLGLIISGITLLGCLGYLGWDFAKKRKTFNKGLK